MANSHWKKCPFCGSERAKSFNSMGPSYPDSDVKCRDCGASAPVEVWNERVEGEKA